jgi:hypothetical protein
MTFSFSYETGDAMFSSVDVNEMLNSFSFKLLIENFSSSIPLNEFHIDKQTKSGSP